MSLDFQFNYKILSWNKQNITQTHLYRTNYSCQFFPDATLENVPLHLLGLSDALRTTSYLCHVVRCEWPPRACIAAISDVINMRLHRELFWHERRACDGGRRRALLKSSTTQNQKPSFKNVDDH